MIRFAQILIVILVVSIVAITVVNAQSLNNSGAAATVQSLSANPVVAVQAHPAAEISLSNLDETAGAIPLTGPTDPCGWGDKYNQVVNGKLYAGPGFNLKVFIRHNPGISWDELNQLNPTVEVGAIPGTGLAWGSMVGCNVIVLPSR